MLCQELLWQKLLTSSFYLGANHQYVLLLSLQQTRSFSFLFSLICLSDGLMNLLVALTRYYYFTTYDTMLDGGYTARKTNYWHNDIFAKIEARYRLYIRHISASLRLQVVQYSDKFCKLFCILQKIHNETS